MSLQAKNGPGGVKGFSCCLPIPFAKGSAMDYQRMSVDQLQKFIIFMYRSQYNKDLPNSNSSSIKPPTWWPESISFDKSLRLKLTTTQKALAPRLQKELSTLIHKCYEYNGVLSMLAIGKELANLAGEYSLQKANASIWKVVDTGGRTVIMVDTLTRTYDACTKDRPVFVEKQSQENLEVVNPSHEKRAPSRETANIYGKSKRSVSKRKIVGESEGELQVESFQCQYCNKHFRGKDFCEEHQSQCVKGPEFAKMRESQLNFMDALGLRDKNQEKLPSSKSLPNDAISTRSRSTRKLPKKQQLMNVIKNNPIPLSSELGKRLVGELEGKVGLRYPPEYEKLCQPKSGLPITDKEYPSNTKRVILKHADNPHIYSCGRRQRLIRYQELVIGVNQNCWGVLNSCKTVKIVTEKLDPRMKSIVVPSNLKNTTYLQRKWKPAITLPQVRLVDFRKHFTEDIRQLMPANRVDTLRPGSTKFNPIILN